MRREYTQSLFKFIVTLIVWGGILLVGMFQDLDIVTFLGFLTVFLIIFRLLAIIESLERDITHIVRDNALKELKKKNK